VTLPTPFRGRASRRFPKRGLPLARPCHRIPQQVVDLRTHLDNAGVNSRGPCPGNYYQPIGDGSSSLLLLPDESGQVDTFPLKSTSGEAARVSYPPPSTLLLRKS
jgi:hypothetical protein